MQANIPTKYGLIWYSTSILGSWNSHWSLVLSATIYTHFGEGVPWWFLPPAKKFSHAFSLGPGYFTELLFDDLTKIWWNEPISFLVSKTWAAGGTRTLGLHLPAPHLLRWTLREGKSVRSPAGAAPLYWWGGSTMHDVVIWVAQGFGYCLSSWCSSCYTFDSWLL